MNIIEAYIKHFNHLIILIIGIPTSNKSEIAKELFTDINPTFTLININDYMNGFTEKEVDGVKFKLYDYPDNIKWNKLDDGLLSMFMANEIYKNTYDNKQSNEKMKSLIEYNEIDCKTMQVLLKFIREF